MPSLRVPAAVISSPGAEPHIADVEMSPRIAGTTLVRVLAAPINPLDLAIASGAMPAARHERPYVPGIECTGTVVESDRYSAGTPVYVDRHPSPTAPGCLATHVLAADEDLLPIPIGVDPVRAAAVGNAGIAAFLPLVDRAALRPGEAVLVLGATGAVGQLAVQVAREHGAGRIVGVGRDLTALDLVRDLGAHSVIALRPDDDEESLAARLGADVPAVDVVLDALYALPLQAALRVCAPSARVVNIGNAAGPSAHLSAGLLRSRQLTLSGFATYTTSLARKRPALEWLWDALARDALHIDVRTYSLDDLPKAWQAQRSSPHVKCVVVPGTEAPVSEHPQNDSRRQEESA
jgi:NADPH2:quinone reductase